MLEQQLNLEVKFFIVSMVPRNLEFGLLSDPFIFNLDSELCIILVGKHFNESFAFLFGTDLRQNVDYRLNIQA